ncbi:vitamin K epoxide reductase family protein [Aureitalea marina]|uniref:Vitamin K epoxide reductase domain-containing protein n=1 Tax=Aureitalea marina TaxID=930804 RepID=A0A2S7KLV4_9FLAO|nr:vitamin K epoxide reductase family protein [Aureitalea marina]PQB03570.1 hypothetical protein BST85_00650 [Aureitalea marina]
MKAHLYNLVKKLIRKNQIRINEEELRMQLQSHPSYPSLHAITGVLEHFNIPNAALRLPRTLDILQHLPPCFLAQTKGEVDEELALVNKKGKSLVLTHDYKHQTLLTEEAFLESWTGILIAIEQDEAITQTTPNSRIGSIGWGALLITLATYFTIIMDSWFPRIHFVLSLLGMVISYFIVKHELGISDKLTQQICNSSDKMSCDAVLDSKGAKLFGRVKLSDLSLVSFLSITLTWLLLVWGGITNYSSLIVCAIASLPVVAYSLYYQLRVVKQWCPLCLGVVCVLLLQFGSLFIGGSFRLSPIVLSVNSFGVLILSTLLVSLVWTRIQPLIFAQKELSQFKFDHLKFKRNYPVFKGIYQASKPLAFNQDIPGEIILGNHHAQTHLILVTSPYCIHCKEAHKDIESILSGGKDKVKVSIRFMAGTDDKDSDFYHLVVQLFDLYHTQGQAACLLALHELYAEHADPAAWLARRKTLQTTAYDTAIQAQKNWCLENSSHFTPALYLSDRPYPKEYLRQDILYFLDDIAEETRQEQPIANKDRLAS